MKRASKMGRAIVRICVTEEEMEESMMGPIGPLLICVKCGARYNQPMESDAWMYQCDGCDERGLCSVEELLIRGSVEIVGPDYDGPMFTRIEPKASK